MEKSITVIMLKEHTKINNFLEDFEKSIKNNSKNYEKDFNKFKWNLEKHFFIEEKVIFTIFNSANEDESEDILNLLREHKDILFIIENIEENSYNNIEEEALNLKKILKNHTSFENEIFYPRLDDELNETQKCLIIKRCEEIIKE